MSHLCALYLIRNDHTGLIKIGVSVDVRKRLVCLERAAGVRLHVLASIEAASDLERSLHDALYQTRTIGEWFGQSHDLMGIVASPSRVTILALIEKNRALVAAHKAEVFRQQRGQREEQSRKASEQFVQRWDDDHQAVADKTADREAKHRKRIAALSQGDAARHMDCSHNIASLLDAGLIPASVTQ